MKEWFLGWINGVLTEYPIKRKHILIGICVVSILILGYIIKR